MASINYKAEGIVTDIQRFSVHDGPGIRTIVFLKGCPLSCFWCCNPETQSKDPVILFQKDRCVRCGKCVSVCRQHAPSLALEGRIDRDKCIGCGECASVCPTGALVLKGDRMTVEQVVRILKKDSIIYRKSKGGITLSGGEALVQWKYAVELLKGCKAQGWHTAIETTGFGSPEAIESVFTNIDLALMDIKSMNPDVHKRVTGVSPEIIHRNARRIAELTQLIIRVPTIPTENATEKDFEQICAFAKTLPGVDTIHILPYHRLGVNKYDLLHKDYPMGHEIDSLKPKDVVRFQEIVERNGFHCLIGG